ncbi:hypothetical protein PARPLA_00028 [Rhodobacteraceae bacterium THAF1]|uniref:hypothetical protein n=1 Tax=Palleronia sp. THAF1 TaxID=2587842 RepID=UPI000F3E59F4|nr:hypothetical protein [Palleronia sp. THAF1]QFU07156.1 hypothetical protein FIU81_00495 [Palleronia sp. THAF1]VDC16689.1 hypothetical protein PARPLA_00028 [Rhodobacteraceae bacterium THAF1]
MNAFLAAFDALPIGAFEGTYQGARWRAVKSVFSDGKSQKLVAEEAGGKGYISLNLYRLSDGRALLKPCEMPEQVVIDFVLSVSVGAGPRADQS